MKLCAAINDELGVSFIHSLSTSKTSKPKENWP